MTYYLFFLTIWASFMTAYAVKLRHVNRTHQISYSQQREDKEYLNALIEVAVEENLQKRKLII